MKISLPTNYLLVILLLTSTLFHHVSTTNLALTFDANNNTCTAACNICCICSGGGWTRITYLDMSDSTEEYPTWFRLYQSGGVRACGRQRFEDFSCQSVKFPSYGISYTQVCGIE